MGDPALGASEDAKRAHDRNDELVAALRKFAPKDASLFIRTVILTMAARS
jgi:hypothetical protein